MPSGKVNQVDLHVGQRVRMRRLELNMSQETLANALDLSFQQVQKYEKGTNRIGSSRLQQIADVLKTSAAFFFEGVPGSHSVEASNELSRFLTLPDGIAIAQAFLSLPADSKLRRNVRDVIVGVAECFNSTAAQPAQRRVA
jgi:transcriptional regulator with XRE-family HTH domain